MAPKSGQEVSGQEKLDGLINVPRRRHYRAPRQLPSNTNLIPPRHVSSLINLPISHNVALVGREGEKTSQTNLIDTPTFPTRQLIPHRRGRADGSLILKYC